MAQEKPSRLTEWIVLLRGQLPVARRRFAEWVNACREEPRLIWEAGTVRYATYGLAGLMVVWSLLAVAGGLAPARLATARPEATEADFHVICSDPQCGHHFVIRREFGFRKFPVSCPKCGQRTGERAYRCNSQTCRGRWVVPVKIDGQLRCSRCNEPLD